VTEDEERRFREFAAARMNHLRGLAYLTCGDWHLAEDAVSTALTRMYVRWQRIDDPDSYARTVVVHAAVDERRRPWRRERASGDLLPEGIAPDEHSRSDERSRLLAALARLSRGQRAVVVLRFYEGLSIEQVAQIIGRSTGTVKSQAARGLAALRAVLSEQDRRDERAAGSATGSRREQQWERGLERRPDQRLDGMVQRW
jgi:RNA polymerase sigma-70 factor (sigma-E family)